MGGKISRVDAETSGIDNILKVLDKSGSRTVTVFGDYCLDRYLYIDPARDETSVETGLIAYQVDRKASYPGAGGTITNNLRSLGVHVQCIGLLGDDGEGHDLLKGLQQIGADTSLMVQSETISTNTYIKPMRQSNHQTYLEMNRLDIRNFKETSPALENRLITHLKQSLDQSQGVIVIEQFLQRNHSAVTDRIRENIAEWAIHFPDKFFLVDSRKFAGDYHHIIIKCNQLELPGTGKNENIEDETSIVNRAEQLLHNNNAKAVIVTLGSKGALVFEQKTTTHIPAFPVKGPLDIVGAGDATNAGTILGLTLGLTLAEAVLLGGCVSSITIQQIGITGTATIDQIKHRLQNFSIP